MSSVAAIVQMMKEGIIDKNEMLRRIESSDASIDLDFESTHRMSLESNPRMSLESNNRLSLELQDLGTEFQTGRGTPRTQQYDFNLPFGTDRTAQTGQNGLTTQRSEPSADFFRRQENFLWRKAVTNHKLQNEKSQKEIKGCTFHPETNDSKKQLKEPVLARLTKEPTRHKAKIYQVQRDKAAEKEIVENCTFKPIINTDYMPTKFGYPRMCRSTAHHATEQENKWPFRPTLSTRNQTTLAKSIQGWTNQPVHDRLYGVHLQKMEAEEDTLVSEDHEFPYYASVTSSQTTSEEGLFSQKSFFERQAYYENMKKERKEDREIQHAHQPAINDRSRKMVQTTFNQRNADLVAKKSQATEPELDFKPAISQSSCHIPHRSIDDMVYGDVDRKLLKSAALKQKIEAETEKPTFHPKLNPGYEHVQGFLQITKSPENYIRRQKSRDLEFKRKCERSQRDRDNRDMEECTHAPEISQIPKYISRIAKNMAVLRSEQGTRHTTKPLWK